MDTIGPWELLIVLFVLIALFGASRLPKIARGLGEGIREFKKGISDANTSADGESSAPAEQEPGVPAEPSSPPTSEPHTPTH